MSVTCAVWLSLRSKRIRGEGDRRLESEFESTVPCSPTVLLIEKEAPVYTLGLKFTRGTYRAIIIVQSNATIKAADMMKLGKIVDGRIQHTG